MKKRTLALFLALAMMFGLVACGGNTNTSSGTDTSTSTNTGSNAGADTSTNEVFKMASYLQLTGANSLAGNAAKNGVDLAIKVINEAGGLNGAKIEIDHYDTTGSTEEAVKVVQKVLAQDVDCVMGSVNSNEVSACIPYLNEAKVYNFGLGTGAAWMEDQSMIYTFRCSCNNNRTVPQDVQMIKDLGYETVAVINSTDDSARTTAITFLEVAEEAGLKILTHEQCDPDDTDFAGQISKLLAVEADIIFMSLQGTTFGPFTKQLRNSGYNGMICASQAMANDQLEIAGQAPNTNYIFVAYPYVTYPDLDSCTIPNVHAFSEMYLETYGVMPEHESAYRGWDTMMVLWEAAKIAGANDDESLREATHKVQIEGLGGQIDLTKGDREAYSSFNGFIKFNNQDLLFSDWYENGGYDDYLKTTGRAK